MSTPQRELRAIFRSRVAESFVRARICATYARTAHADGATDEVRQWIDRIRTLRVAAARWRRRAHGLVPALLLLALVLNGCVHPPVRVTESLTVPPALIRLVCGKWRYPGVPGDAHWDGYATLIWDRDDTEIAAVDCSLTSLSAGMITLTTRIDIRDDECADLREFLADNGIETNWAP